MTACWNGAPVATTVPCASYSTMTTSGSVVPCTTTFRCSPSLRLGPLAGAAPDEIVGLLRPCFETLAGAAENPATDAGPPL
jgi:hypothetical protein